jgi:hypothetical protein
MLSLFFVILNAVKNHEVLSAANLLPKNPSDHQAVSYQRSSPSLCHSERSEESLVESLLSIIMQHPINVQHHSITDSSFLRMTVWVIPFCHSERSEESLV